MITKKEFLLLQKHVVQDIKYGDGGTFGTGDDQFNQDEATKVAHILIKIAETCVK